MPYFFADRRGDEVVISGGDARHLALSLRARPGQSISVIQPEGKLLDVILESVTPAQVRGRVVAEADHRPEPRARVTLGIAMLPAAALELVLSRCTEAGAAGFVLVQARRSVAKAAKAERWATICREAAMLAGRLRVPDVMGPMSLKEALAVSAPPFLLDRRSQGRLAWLHDPRDVTLFVGPEGGWTDDELALAEGHVVSLGPRNLRADTAALTALAVALAARGDV